MALRGAGLSFKLASVAYLLTEIAVWCNDLGSDASSDELDGTVFSPGALIAPKIVLYGAVTRTFNLSGRWSPTVETFFSALSGSLNVPYQQSPEGTAIGKVMIFGDVNVGAWSGPQQEVNGVIGFTIPLSVNTRTVRTWITPPATIAITSSSVADPTVLVTAAHGITVGATEVVTIATHTGSTPAINGTHIFTATSATTGTIPVNVTVGGTGGTLQKY
jgi:hypothetical protein